MDAAVDPVLKHALIERFDEISDRSTAGTTSLNRDGWWRDPLILERLPGALARPFRSSDPTLVLGPQSSEFLLGPLVARELGAGFVPAHKAIRDLADSDVWIRATTPPDYRDRHLELGFRRGGITGGDRVLIVDDWVDTGSQLFALQQLVRQVGARIVGTAVIADGLSDRRVRRELEVTALVQARELWR